MNFLYPFTLMITFLHETSHAFAALISGGHVLSLQINADGSGHCVTSGGNQLFIVAAGYLGSIFLGNLILNVGIKWKNLAPVLILSLATFMLISSFIWFGSLFTFVFSGAFSLCLVLIVWKVPKVGNVFLIFLGIYSVLYIIRDFNVGPTSDLAVFSRITFLPSVIWMYIWLGIAIVITGINLYLIFRKK